ncbi:MAG: flavodoxin family protein [Alphaproteobacteria bacterium]
MAPAKRLLVVAHAPSPNTAALRDAVVEGAHEVAEVDTVVLGPFETGPADVLAAQAVILGTTENLGYMSGALKDFFDRCYYPLLDHTEALPYALYVRAGQDGTGTRRAVESITTGLRWKRAHAPVICRGAWDDGFLDQVRELGMYMAAGLDAGIL